jgi:hypothetical protein
LAFVTFCRNPQGPGWTHSAGDILQIRQRNHDGFSYPVLQTTAAINPGNSGGGAAGQFGSDGKCKGSRPRGPLDATVR